MLYLRRCGVARLFFVILFTAVICPATGSFEREGQTYSLLAGNPGGLADVNAKYAGVSVLVATMLTSVSHDGFVDGCIALHHALFYHDRSIPSVAFVVNEVSPALVSKQRAAVARMREAGLEVVEIDGLADGAGYNGGESGTWIGQTSKFMLWQLTAIKRVVYMDNDIVLRGSIKSLLQKCAVGKNSAQLCAGKQDSDWNREHWCTIYWQASVFVFKPSWDIWLDLRQAALRLAQGPFVAQQTDGDPHKFCRGKQSQKVVTEQDLMVKYFSGKVQLLEELPFMSHCKSWRGGKPQCSPNVKRKFREALAMIIVRSHGSGCTGRRCGASPYFSSLMPIAAGVVTAVTVAAVRAARRRGSTAA
jgi:hypothetical protein